MYTWLMQYAETFGEEFPLRLFSKRSEYEVRQIIIHCLHTGKKYEPVKKKTRKK